METVKLCVVCDSDFKPRRGGKPQVYCSSLCRNRASQKRHQDNGNMAAWRETFAPKKRNKQKLRWDTDPEYRRKILVDMRWRHLKKKYGLTQTDYDALCDKQEHRCAICGAQKADDSGKEWNVDHDHKTGKVRGLLCRRCNGGLGWFRDNPVALRAAADYVEKNKCE